MWVGLIVKHESLLKLITEESVEGINYTGRPGMECTKVIMNDQRCDSYLVTKRKAVGRNEWLRTNLRIETKCA